MKVQGLIVVAASLLIGSLASASPLAGTYNVQTSDCMVGAQGIKQVVVTANARSVNYAAVISFEGQPGYQNVHSYDMIVGTDVEQMMGDGKFKFEGAYSVDQTSFDYAEYDTETASSNDFNKLRSTSMKLSGNTLTIIEHEEGFNPRVCVLTTAP